ncbi:MAG: succinylglutamate desuccinylase/aspartoacylase family protein, partial [Alphaproteobacteria bacterium]|nr:succinylglutamate desuccinylase/aspartoacylase family protein [Alphaproteobacteria bacterium]
MMIEKTRFESGKSGPDLLVLGGIHGTEVCGTIAAQRIIDEINSGKIKLLSGTLTLAPVCNPRAREQMVRHTGENLNRVIKHWDAPDTYEKELGGEVATLIDNATHVLDIHSTPTEVPPFVFLDYPTDETRAMAGCAPVDFKVSGWNAIYET